MRYQMKNSVYIFIFSVIIGFVVSGLIFRKCCNTPEVIKTDTITKTDTFWRDTIIKDTLFEPKYIVKKKVDTVYTKGGDTLQLVTEQKIYEKSLVSGKDTADLQLYVSGINTALDSLNMRLKTHSVTNTVEITKYIENKKWIYVAPSVGFGYGIFTKKPDIYVGVSVGINL
jgi:hypothetical protein